MTALGKSVIIGGILIFTVGTLMWILEGDWHWFAGGGTLFLASVLTSAVISAETKPSNHSIQPPRLPLKRRAETRTRTEYDPERTDPQTQRIPQIEDDWEQPRTPPPDHKQGQGIKDGWS